MKSLNIHLLTCLLALSSSLIAFNANSALIGRDLDGNLTTAEAYYDTDSNISWLSDANLSIDSIYDTRYPGSGRMTWDNANSWVANLTINGIDGWRLPTQLNPDPSCNIQDSGLSYGQGCTGSEMGDLFYNVLGGSESTSIHTSHNSNYYLFSNIQTNYWTYVEHWFPTNRVVGSFNVSLGAQNYTDPELNWYVWAVHDGVVGSAVVPVPPAIALFLSGLFYLGIFVKRKTK